MIRYIITIVLVVISSSAVTAAIPVEKQSWFYKGLDYKGVAVQEDGYHVWGSSPIIGSDGKVHLFVARYPNDTYNFDPGWRIVSEIAHYVSVNSIHSDPTAPEGPFVFSDLTLDGTDDPADPLGQAPHNPCIQKVGDTYVLLFIAREVGTGTSTQKIGMVTSTSLYGPWTRAGSDGVILTRSTDPSDWNYLAGNGAVNPAFVQQADGRFFLYFKSQDTRSGYSNVSKMGLAIAENLTGPYEQLPVPITNNDTIIEDGYAFLMNGQTYLVTTDNHGMILSGGGLFWKSADGISFPQLPLAAFDKMNVYFGGSIPAGAKTYYGAGGKFERPQVLMIDEKPAYFYAPSGTSVYDENGDGNYGDADGTISYVFKFNPDNLSCGDWGYLPEDLDENCVVDANDLALLMTNWLR